MCVQLHPGRPLRVGVAAVLFVSIAAGQTRLYIDSRPTNLDPVDPICRLIFRELPRQALVVEATEEFSAICIDPTIEPSLTPTPNDTVIGLDRKSIPDRMLLSVSLFDKSNRSLGNFDIPQKGEREQAGLPR